MILFGALVGVLSAAGIDAESGHATSLNPSTEFYALIWPFVAFTMAISLAFLFYRNSLPRFVSILIPILAAGLLFLPFFLNSNSESMSRALIAFLIICESAIFSEGPSNAKHIFTCGRACFVFWEREWGLIGLVAGYCGATATLRYLSVSPSHDLILAGAIAYGVLTLAVVSLLERAWNIGRKSDRSSQSESRHLDVIAQQAQLTPRETEIFRLLAEGRSAPFIQKELCISRGTAVTHINHIYQKLGIHSRQELISLAQNSSQSDA